MNNVHLVFGFNLKSSSYLTEMDSGLQWTTASFDLPAEGSA